MHEFLDYFRAILEQPLEVPTFSQWWEKNEVAVREVCSRRQYLKLKFRKVAAIIELMEEIGHEPKELLKATPFITRGSCLQCGERTSYEGKSGGWVACPNCGRLFHADLRRDVEAES